MSKQSIEAIRQRVAMLYASIDTEFEDEVTRELGKYWHEDVPLLLKCIDYLENNHPIFSDMTRDEVITKLKAAGIHIASMYIPEGAKELTPAERETLGRVPPGSPTTTEIIDEDRGA